MRFLPRIAILPALIVSGILSLLPIQAQEPLVADLDLFVTLPGAYQLTPDDLEKRFEKGKRAPSISLHLSKKNLRHQDALRAASKVSSTEAQKNTGSATSRQITRLQEQGIFC
jgi:hypothetical protein